MAVEAVELLLEKGFNVTILRQLPEPQLPVLLARAHVEQEHLAAVKTPK
jgi:hypothetical protein